MKNDNNTPKDAIDSLVYEWTWSRIDARLATQLPYSRSFFGHLIEGRRIVVIQNNNQAMYPKKSYMLKNGEKINIESMQRYVDGGILQEANRVDLEIRVEDEDYTVIHKPKWVLSHPTSVWDLETPSVVARAYHHYKHLPTVWNFIRAWLVHRLDKDTSGLMILAKTEKWLAHFKSLFQQKSLAISLPEKESVLLKKYYTATSHTTPQGLEFLESNSKLPHYIIEDVIPKVPNATIKEWITKILSISDGSTEWQLVLDIEILTGRTHQIRYHLSQLGLPIVWDYLYGIWDEQDKLMLLEASRLEFRCPNGDYKTVLV